MLEDCGLKMVEALIIFVGAPYASCEEFFRKCGTACSFIMSCVGEVNDHVGKFNIRVGVEVFC